LLRLPNISPHVLVLDDDLDALEEIQEILELDDLICVTASNTNDARQALSNDPCISAIVTDVHLRGSDETGLDFIAGLGDELADREMTFIVLSGDPSAIVPSIQTGAVDFLTKPLVPEDLLRAIRSRMKADIADVLFRKVEETTKSLQQAHINLAEAELSLSESNDAYERRRIMGGKLRQGLKDGHILPWFQPQICIETGVILGFEALVRWDDPVRGLQNPAEFLPLAHEIGLIIELDHAVQKQAFETDGGAAAQPRSCGHPYSADQCGRACAGICVCGGS